MALYKSAPGIANASAQQVYAKLSNLEGLKDLLDKVPESAIPADKKDMFNSVRITSDTISFPAGPVGELTMKVVEKIEPVLIRLEGVGTPVAISLKLELGEVSSNECEVAVSIDIAIPAMLKPMIGGTLQKMVDQFAQVICSLKY